MHNFQRILREYGKLKGFLKYLCYHITNLDTDTWCAQRSALSKLRSAYCAQHRVLSIERSLVHCTPTRCTRSILPTSTLTTYTLPPFILHTSSLHTMHYAHRWFSLLGLPMSTLPTRCFAHYGYLDLLCL